MPGVDLDDFGDHVERSIRSWKSVVAITGKSKPDEKLLRKFEWPEALRGAVEKHGALRVWEAGLSVLGFPPTWWDFEPTAEYPSAWMDEKRELILKKLEQEL